MNVEPYDEWLKVACPSDYLCVATHQGTYKATPVEIKEYVGGPDNSLVRVDDLLMGISELMLKPFQTVMELVGLYQTFDKYVPVSWCSGVLVQVI
jgi:hypothetical protein